MLQKDYFTQQKKDMQQSSLKIINVLGELFEDFLNDKCSSEYLFNKEHFNSKTSLKFSLNGEFSIRQELANLITPEVIENTEEYFTGVKDEGYIDCLKKFKEYYDRAIERETEIVDNFFLGKLKDIYDNSSYDDMEKYKMFINFGNNYHNISDYLMLEANERGTNDSFLGLMITCSQTAEFIQESIENLCEKNPNVRLFNEFLVDSANNGNLKSATNSGIIALPEGACDIVGININFLTELMTTRLKYQARINSTVSEKHEVSTFIFEDCESTYEPAVEPMPKQNFSSRHQISSSHISMINRSTTSTFNLKQ